MQGIHKDTGHADKKEEQPIYTYLNQPWFQVGVNNDVIPVFRMMMMSYSVTYMVTVDGSETRCWC